MVLENMNESVDSVALEALIAQKLYEKVPEYTVQVQNILTTDKNNKPFTLINNCIQKEEGGKVALEDMGTSIDIHVLSPKKVLDVVRVGTDPERGDLEQVEESTMKSLKAFCTDFEKFKSDIESQMEEVA